METLVEIAKRIGIFPNPHMSERDWAVVRIAIGRELEKNITGLPEYASYEKYHHENPIDLFNNLYHVRKLLDRRWPEGTAEKLLQIMRTTKHEKDIFIHSNSIGFKKLEESSFIFHHALTHTKDIKERIVADIDLASPYLPSMVQKMDDFILKHKGKFKIVNNKKINRSDTMNVYLEEDISPKTLEEFHSIVKPCLCEDNHHLLDGFDIMAGNKPIKGIKIGPELNENKQAYESRKKWVDKTLTKDIRSPELRKKAANYLEKLIGHSSLGEKESALQIIDLMYYCLNIGKSPFHYISYDGSFYNKQLHISDIPEKKGIKAPEEKTEKKSFFEYLFQGKELKFNWKDPAKWQDVVVQGGENNVYFGHRINISNLDENQRNQIRKGLKKENILYTERQATKKGIDIEVGDWTIRVSDPQSIRQLRRIIFNWETGPAERPVSMGKDEFYRQQNYLKELSGRTKKQIPDSPIKNPVINQHDLTFKRREINSKNA